MVILPNSPLFVSCGDLGSSQSLLLRDVTPLSDALIQGVECSFLNIPLHVEVMHSLPVISVHLLLGNDLA